MSLPIATPRGVVRRWIAAFNAADPDALAALYHDDATNHQVALHPVKGRDAIHAMFVKEFAGTQMECLPVNLFEDGEWAILEWKDPQDRLGCGFFHVIDGRIALQRGYWDSATFAAPKRRAPVKKTAAKPKPKA
ncbi:nuclear transport factor 2 family protein [Sphingomonas sp.]|uniref:nuclear transport factor 2 family protein n=1 Tax=Sphingomonas sp. TaxID=28214 RepID=UPI0025FA7CD1|nr:nuclear transport factor 2 family protein [Sphingomonas sp.]